MLNKVILIGRFTRDPELKSSATGVSICRFSLGVTRNFKNASGEYDSDFIECTSFRSTAEFISKYFKKGSLVCVEGSLQNNNWEKDGVKHYSMTVLVDNTYFVESKKTNDGNGNNSYGSSDPMASLPEGFAPIDSDDELPF